MLSSPARIALALSLATSLGALGCGRSFQTELATPVASEHIPATLAHDKARVVFVRPSGWASQMRIDIIDEDGHYVGTSLAESYFYVDVEPGAHMYVGWSKTTAPLWAVLEGGNEYYVEVTPDYRFGKQPGVRLKPVSKRIGNWYRVSEWLAECDYTAVDQDTGERWLRDFQSRADERVRIANNKMANYDADERNERTLFAEDGKPPLTAR